LALNMLGVFEIGTSWMGAGSSLADRGGHLGSFFTGVLATAVATPCTAPFMGVAIGFALTQSVAAIMLIFSALGLGLAAPYVLLAFNPQWARILPKPGLWMLKFKQAMSFPLFGAAIWLVWVYGEEQDINGVALLLAGLLLLAVAVWLHAAFKQSVARTTVTVCLILSGIALPLVLRTTRTQDATAPASVAKAAKPADTLLWEKFSPAKLEQYRAAAKPVLVDFSAAWCVTCQINERLVLRSAEIQRRLKEQDIALLKADWTAYDPEITAALAEHGRVGVPFYLMYGDARQPIIETEILTSSTLLAALDRVRSTP